MNAHTTIAPESQVGRAPLDEQVLAVQQADLLQYLAGPEPASEISAVAAALDRDPSNLRKTLQRLEREGIVTSKPVAITDKGRAWIPRLAALAGAALQEGQPVLTWAQIRIDPDNPRTIMNAEADDRLVENIARRGLKQPVLVRLDPDGKGATLNDGFRRHSAIGKLIERGDPRWPAHKPIPYHLNEATEAADILADAIVANLHHEHLHPLDQAAGYAKLKDLGWSPAKILEECGVERRFYEQRLDLLHLTDAQKARMRLDKDDTNYLSVKGARGLLQHLRHIASAESPEQTDLEARTLDLTDKLQLALLEVAFAIEQKPGRDGALLTHRPAGGGLATLAERGLLHFIHSHDRGRVTVEIPKAAAAGAWLSEQGFYDDPAGVVFKAREAVFGASRAQQLADEQVYATDELNTDPAVFRGRRFPNATHAAEARRLAMGGGPSNGGGGTRTAKPTEPPAGPNAEPEALDRHLQLRLLELAAKIEREKLSIVGIDFGATRVGRYWLDGKLDRLTQELKLVAFANPGGETGWVGYLTPAGWIAVADVFPGLDMDERLDRARAACGQAFWAGPGYVLDWLNVAAPTLAPAPAPEAPGQSPPLPQPETEDDEKDDAAAEAVLQRVRAGLKSGMFGRNGGAFDYIAFRDLLEAAELIGPFDIDPENPGLVDDRNAHSPVVCDTNGDLPHALALAQAELVSFALNAVAGFSHPQREG